MTGEELRKKLKGSGKAIGEIAVMLDMTRQGLGLYFNKKVVDPYFIKKIEDKTGITLDGNKTLHHPAEITQIDLQEQNVMWVPLVSQYAYAGYINGLSDPEYLETLPLEPFIADKEYKGTYMCFEVRGDSMDDDSKRAICAGDKLLCREIGRQHWKSKLHIEKYSFVLGMKGDGVICKKIIKHDVEKGILTLHSLNSLYEDYKVKLDDVAILFNVVEIKRRP